MKEERVAKLNKFRLDSSSSVEDMRKRLVRYRREGPPPAAIRPAEALTIPEAGSSRRSTPDTKPVVSPPSPTVQSTVPTRRPSPKIHWNLSFDGRGDPVALLEKLTDILTTEGIQPSDILPYIPYLLKEEPALWYRSNRHVWTTWDQFTKIFRIVYYSVNYQDDLLLETGRRQ